MRTCKKSWAGALSSRGARLQRQLEKQIIKGHIITELGGPQYASFILEVTNSMKGLKQRADRAKLVGFINRSP